jgi:tRNA (guanine10-N2)-methyltransferase
MHTYMVYILAKPHIRTYVYVHVTIPFDTCVYTGEMYAGSADRKKDPTKRDIFENFKTYGLDRPELVRLDNHLLDRHVMTSRETNTAVSSSVNASRIEGFYESIVTDPPYGIRAGAKKSGNPQKQNKVTDELRAGHIPSTQHYPVNEVMLDLLHAAARLLVM